MENENKFIIDNMKWSFSRLNSFNNCPHEWYETYIMCNKGEDNFFGEFGSCCHKVLEQYAKNETSIFEISDKYMEQFSKTVLHEAPPNKYVDIAESYYNKGLDYFDNLDLDLGAYEILGIEKEVHFQIGGKDFVGYIDLLLKEKETGKIIILDHKSASIKLLKNGSVSKSDQKHFREFIRQLCLYSIPVIKEYGKVDELWWNLLKDQKWIKIDFNQEDFEESIKWAEETIKMIEKETEFPCNPDFYYCYYLCSHRNEGCMGKPQPSNNTENTEYGETSIDRL